MNQIILKNETNDIILNPFISHYLNIKFASIPFLWHYNDFSEPFPIYAIKKINIYKLKSLLNNSKNITLQTNLFSLNDKNCDIYIIAQYRNIKAYYSSESNIKEIYLSYHTLLYYNLTKKNTISNDKINYKFRFLTGIYSIEGDLQAYQYYPFKNEYNKKPGGIPINNLKLETRQATIHSSESHIKFSGINSCNFNINSDNSVFVSIIKQPTILHNNNKVNIVTNKNKQNCVVMHLFRNIPDNNPLDDNYQELFKKYFEK